MASQLDRDLAELRQVSESYAARHQFIPDFSYPPGVRIAVNFTLDFDSMLLRRLLNEPPMQLAKGEFGGRVGIWRLIELFDAHKVKATIFTPGRACELYRRQFVLRSEADTRSPTICGSTASRRRRRSKRTTS